jgi:maleamate amidohydrolase
MIDRFEDHCWKDVVDSDVLDLYRFYQRDVYVGGNVALLAIDLYELAYEGGPLPVNEVTRQFPSSCGEYAWEAIEPTKRLLAAARRHGLPIFFTTGEARPDSKPSAVRATNRRRDKVTAEQLAIRADFAPQPGEVIVRKSRASGFFGTPLIAHLTQLDVRSLIVIGEATSGCVRSSVVDAFSYGFHVSVAEECCFDRYPLTHKLNLFDMHHKYADVMHVDEVIAELDSAAAGAAVPV